MWVQYRTSKCTKRSLKPAICSKTPKNAQNAQGHQQPQTPKRQNARTEPTVTRLIDKLHRGSTLTFRSLQIASKKVPPGSLETSSAACSRVRHAARSAFPLHKCAKRARTRESDADSERVGLCREEGHGNKSRKAATLQQRRGCSSSARGASGGLHQFAGALRLLDHVGHSRKTRR